jgi:hypothetical protein
MAQQIESRLARSFADATSIEAEFGDRRVYGLMRLLNSVVLSTIGRKTAAETKAGHWLDDPYGFDQAVIAINTVLELIGPAGEIPPSPAEGAYQGKFNALATLLDIQKAPDVLPTRASRHARAMFTLKRDISDLVDRALIYGSTAEQTRHQARQFGELIQELAPLQLKARKTPDAMSNEELRRLEALTAQVKRLRQQPI